jgi:small GTP-binding protein
MENRANHNRIVTIVGRPNVGKSSLFNRLVGKRVAIEASVAGTTRDQIVGEVIWRGEIFTLIDVAGIETINIRQELSKATQESITNAITNSDLILFVVDWNDKFNDKEIHKFERNEIPDILLSNRILELFSKPMEERPMFSEHLTHENPLEEVTIKYYGKNGANYERFDLVLPVNSKVKRINSDQIEIKTNRFKMNIMVDMSGANTLIAEDFEKYYLSIDDFLKVGIYEIHAIVKIKFNLLSIFSIQGWEYYQWIDSFLKRLNECISKDEFIEHINWDSILTFIHCGNVLRTAQEAAPALEKREQNLIE